jgi:hypothetical protein
MSRTRILLQLGRPVFLAALIGASRSTEPDSTGPAPGSIKLQRAGCIL